MLETQEELLHGHAKVLVTIASRFLVNDNPASSSWGQTILASLSNLSDLIKAVAVRTDAAIAHALDAVAHTIAATANAKAAIARACPFNPVVASVEKG